MHKILECGSITLNAMCTVTVLLMHLYFLSFLDDIELWMFLIIKNYLCPPREAAAHGMGVFVFVWGGRLEGRLPGAPWPLGGRGPGDEDGGIFSVFHLEASTPLSATLDTSWGPVEGRTRPKCPHPFWGAKPNPPVHPRGA